ncbi:hypothetical protein JL720_656 [Aureococcus anophagefferens]|nr:hypothetical protein JL720_656 [Aureococcus anophagefferens]
MSKFARKGKQPAGFEYLEQTLEVLENELRDKINEPHEGKRRTESIWPVHQINWQRSRYVYDMHYKYGKVDKKVLDYCSLGDDQVVECPTTGCRGCASGGQRNIFGNKYGQSLAKIQILREQREQREAAAAGAAADDDDDDAAAAGRRRRPRRRPLDEAHDLGRRRRRPRLRRRRRRRRARAPAAGIETYV